MTPPVMPFGKHKGQPFDKIPRGYFDWLLKQDWLKPELRDEIENYFEDDGGLQDELDFDPRDGAPPPPPANAPPRLGFTETELADLRRVLGAGFRTLALQRDPDPGDIARQRFTRLAAKLRQNGLMEEVK